MSQIDMFAPPTNLDQAFWKFHGQNPQVYEKLIELTDQARWLGKRKIGMKMLFEVIRWDHLVHTRSDDFALNNNYTSRYARLIAEKHPELADMFETRKIKS